MAAKVEPKVYFANERTFLSWMHMSVRGLLLPLRRCLAQQQQHAIKPRARRR